MTVEVTKVTAYAVIRPPKDEVTASKVTVYAVTKDATPSIAVVQTTIVVN